MIVKGGGDSHASDDTRLVPPPVPTTQQNKLCSPVERETLMAAKVQLLPSDGKVM
jgi:hypothetical protein